MRPSDSDKPFEGEGEEPGELAWNDRVRTERFALWMEAAPRIGDDIFLKLYCHGAQERNLEPLLGGGLGNLFRWLAEEAEQRGIEIHWATAWQMYQAADALIHGRDSVPGPAISAGGVGR